MKLLLLSFLAVAVLSAKQGKQTFTGTITAGSEPMDLSEKKSCSVGSEWEYIFNCRKAEKEIAADHNLPVDLFPRRQPLIEVG